MLRKSENVSVTDEASLSMIKTFYYFKYFSNSKTDTTKKKSFSQGTTKAVEKVPHVVARPHVHVCARAATSQHMRVRIS